MENLLIITLILAVFAVCLSCASLVMENSARNQSIKTQAHITTMKKDFFEIRGDARIPYHYQREGFTEADNISAGDAVILILCHLNLEIGRVPGTASIIGLVEKPKEGK